MPKADHKAPSRVATFRRHEIAANYSIPHCRSGVNVRLHGGEAHCCQISGQILGNQYTKLTASLELLGCWRCCRSTHHALDRRVNRNRAWISNKVVYPDLIWSWNCIVDHRRLLGDLR